MWRPRFQRVFDRANLDPRLREGLIHHYVGGGEGNTWFDRSGYGRDAVFAVSTEPTWTLGKDDIRDALESDGGATHRAVAPTVDPGSEMTIALWVKPTSLAVTQVFCGTWSAGWHVRTSNTDSTKLQFYNGSSTYASSVNAFVNGEWVHIAITYRNSTFVRHYINGVETDDVVPGNLQTSGASLYIFGNSGGAMMFPGIMDDIRYYNRALSDVEIAAIAQLPSIGQVSAFLSSPPVPDPPTVDFDGDALLITLPLGVAEVDGKIDLYSDWKEWMKTSPNAKYPLAFDTTGGDPTTATGAVAAYYFLRNDNGWRIKPAEAEGEVVIVGNLYPRDSTLPMFVPTTGMYTVLLTIERDASSVVEAVTSADFGGTLEGALSRDSALRLILAAVTGKLSGSPAGPIIIRDVADAKNRINATVDASGNRTAVTLDGT